MSAIQPGLQVDALGPGFRIHGQFVVADDAGPIDEFSIRLEIKAGHPVEEPRLYETADRIGPPGTRHLNFDHTCCFGVWEAWVLKSGDDSVGALLKGPVFNYFLSQFLFEKTGKWQLGEYAHGAAGVVEAAADMLECPKDIVVVSALIDGALNGTLQKQAACPCGSGRLTAVCHFDILQRARSGENLKILQSLKGKLPALPSSHLDLTRSLVRLMRDR